MMYHFFICICNWTLNNYNSLKFIKCIDIICLNFVNKVVVKRNMFDGQVYFARIPLNNTAKYLHIFRGRWEYFWTIYMIKQHHFYNNDEFDLPCLVYWLADSWSWIVILTRMIWKSIIRIREYTVVFII